MVLNYYNVALGTVMTAFANSVRKANEVLGAEPNPVAIFEFQAQFQFSGTIIQPTPKLELIFSKLSILDVREKVLIENTKEENVSVQLKVKPVIS